MSDNAKTFTAASKHLLKLSKEADVVDHLSGLMIKWDFILENLLGGEVFGKEWLG